MTDTTTIAVERMADELEDNAKIFPNEDDHSSICATLRALAAERDALHAQLAAEKELADRLAEDLKHLTQFHTCSRYQGTLAAYSKARGL